MAYSVIRTDEFEREYDSTIVYLIETLKSPAAARNLSDAVLKALKELADNPFLHSLSRRPLLNDLELRERPVRTYTIVYRVANDCVYLEHLFHQTQDYGRLV